MKRSRVCLHPVIRCVGEEISVVVLFDEVQCALRQKLSDATTYDDLGIPLRLGIQELVNIAHKSGSVTRCSPGVNIAIFLTSQIVGVTSPALIEVVLSVTAF